VEGGVVGQLEAEDARVAVQHCVRYRSQEGQQGDDGEGDGAGQPAQPGAEQQRDQELNQWRRHEHRRREMVQQLLG